MTTVAEEGNRRRGDMTADECEQCILDIKAWFVRSAGGKTMEGASNVDIQRLEKTMDCELPRALKFMLYETNGAFWFLEKEQMSCDAIAQVYTKFEGKKHWRHGCIPFAGDEGMGMLVVDTTNAKAAVFEWDEDDGVSEDPISSSLTAYLEDYRNRLLSGQCEFLEDCGVVEKMGTKAGAANRK